MAEDHDVRVAVREQLVVTLGRLGHECEHVAVRRRVADARAVDRDLLGKPEQLLRALDPEPLAAELDRPVQQLVAGRIRRVLEPALRVAPDPLRVELAERLHRLLGKRARERVVAAQHELARHPLPGHPRRPPRAPAGFRGCRRAARAKAPGSSIRSLCDGCPSPGHGASTSTSRASETARTSWRSFGSVSARNPGPPGIDSPSASTSTCPSTTRIHARSCTW